MAVEGVTSLVILEGRRVWFFLEENRNPEPSPMCKSWPPGKLKSQISVFQRFAAEGRTTRPSGLSGVGNPLIVAYLEPKLYYRRKVAIVPTRNVNLTDELDRFVAKKVKTGRYENASEVVRAGLRTLEREERQYEAKLAALRAAIDEGDASGVAR